MDVTMYRHQYSYFLVAKSETQPLKEQSSHAEFDDL